MMSNTLPRYCHASSSRLPLTLARVRPAARAYSLLPPRANEPVPFFIPPFRSPIGLTPRGHPIIYGTGKGKERDTRPPRDEEEVDDAEWEMRSARAMLHLRETLPRFFDADQSTSTLFPPDVFSQNVVLKITHPIPVKISSLGAYSTAFAVARNGMQALHTHLSTDMERMTFSPAPRDVVAGLDPRSAAVVSRQPIPAHRYKQIRVQVAVRGIVRLPPHHAAVWQTSSLYTLSPRTGLIISHQVESIRPLPGEGVAEWLKAKLLGWTSAQREHENMPNIPCPRTQAIPVRSSAMDREGRLVERYLRERSDGQRDE